MGRAQEIVDDGNRQRQVVRAEMGERQSLGAEKKWAASVAQSLAARTCPKTGLLSCMRVIQPRPLKFRAKRAHSAPDRLYQSTAAH